MRTKTHKNEGKKTLSKKAQIRAGLLLKDSPASSHPGSRRSSRPASRYASEDESESLHGDGDDLEDSVTFSTASGEYDDEDASSAAAVEWPQQLRSCIADLTGGKRVSDAVRQTNLESFLRLVRRHVAHDEIRDSGLELIQALLKSIKSSDNAQERVLAMDALAMTILTYNSESFSDTASIWKLVRNSLQTVCESAEDEAVKVHAVRALATAFVFDCRSREAAEPLLEFLVEIVESDGQAVGAENSSDLVVAAMQAWSFVADVFADKGGDAARAMEAFTDQLESSDADVQLTAAAQIAFLFEAVRPPEDGEEGESGDSDSDNEDERPYLPYQPGALMPRLITAARGSKAYSNGRRHSTGNWFRRIIASVDKGWALRHQTVWRSDVPGSWIVLEVDTMSAWVLMEHLKATLGKGFKEHLMGNAMVREVLDEASVEVLEQRERPIKPTWGGGRDADVQQRVHEMDFLEAETRAYTDD